MAYADLLDLRVELFPYAPFAARTWELRDNVTCYDAWYIVSWRRLRGRSVRMPGEGHHGIASGGRSRMVTRACKGAGRVAAARVTTLRAGGLTR